MIVYKPSKKAMKAAAFNSSDERIVLLGDGSAMHYDLQGRLIQSDLLYRRADSHLTPTGELLPKQLTVDKQEFEHITDNKINLPCKLRPKL